VLLFFCHIVIFVAVINHFFVSFVRVCIFCFHECFILIFSSNRLLLLLYQSSMFSQQQKINNYDINNDKSTPQHPFQPAQ